MRIGKMARLTGKSVATLRYYERVGLLPAPERTESGYRDYPAHMVERVRFIAQAQECGFTLEEIGGMLDLHDHGDVPCKCVVETAHRKLHHVERQLADLRTRYAVLQLAIRRWESGVTGGGQFCPLISEITNSEGSTTQMARKVEVFTAGCPLCEPVVELVQRLVRDRCEVVVHNLTDDPKAVQHAREAGVERVPMVLVDGVAAECCQAGPITEAGLRAAGIGA